MKRMTSTELLAGFKTAAPDYLYNGDVFNEDSQEIRCLKWILTHRLTRAQRTIIIMYAECGSFATLGKALHVSKTCARKQFNLAREAVFNEIRKKCPICS